VVPWWGQHGDHLSGYIKMTNVMALGSVPSVLDLLRMGKFQFGDGKVENDLSFSYTAHLLVSRIDTMSLY
jgi:hypothetical protein